MHKTVIGTIYIYTSHFCNAVTVDFVVGIPLVT
jgi:hypothetical protein